MRREIALAFTLALGACGKPTSIDDRPWALPMWSYSETPDKTAIYVTGTMKGEDVGYKVNTWSIQCLEADKVCHIANVSEIGKDQLGSIDQTDWKVVNWSPQTVVAQDWDPDFDALPCAHNSITINRIGRWVAYDSIAINSDREWCKKFHKPVDYHWTIGPPKQPWEK